MGAAVQHVHHRHRQDPRLAAAVELGEVAVERLLGIGGGGLGGGQGDAEDRVGAEAALVRGAVELDHRLVERALLGGAGAGQRLGDLAVDVGDRLADALADPLVATVAQLDRLELTGRGARGNGGDAARAGLERDLDLDGRVAARIEDLAGVDGGDRAHRGATLFGSGAGRRAAWSDLFFRRFAGFAFGGGFRPLLLRRLSRPLPLRPRRLPRRPRLRRHLQLRLPLRRLWLSSAAIPGVGRWTSRSPSGLERLTVPGTAGVFCVTGAGHSVGGVFGSAS